MTPSDGIRAAVLRLGTHILPDPYLYYAGSISNFSAARRALSSLSASAAYKPKLAASCAPSSSAFSLYEQPFRVDFRLMDRPKRATPDFTSASVAWSCVRLSISLSMSLAAELRAFGLLPCLQKWIHSS